MSEPQLERQPSLLWLLPPLAAGALFRLLNLYDQVLGGDELHAVRVTLLRPFAEILFTYQRSDHCLPLSAFYRLLSEGGVTMTELVFRLPVLVSGLIILLAAPLLVSRFVGRRAALVFSWLLALSPVMIYYSRIVRSYSPMVLLVFCALLFFYSWWRGSGWWCGLLYALFSALALYFHLGAGPIIVAPYVFAVGEMLVDRKFHGREGPGLAHVFVIGAVQVAAVAVFLVPAWSSLQGVVSAKRMEQKFSFSVLGEVLRLQSGSVWLFLTLLFWCAALVGLVLLLRKRPRFGLYTLVIIITHLVGLISLSPYGLKMVHVMNRYLIPVLPFVLLYVAVGLSRLRPWPGRQGVWWGSAVTAVLLILLVLGGPLVNADLLKSSFVHHNDYIRFVSPVDALDSGDVSDFYHRLGRGEIPGGPLVEYPWTTVWHQSQALYLYQRVHGQSVMVGAMDDLLYDPRLRFRNMPAMNADAILASRARYLVIHRDWVREELLIKSDRWIKRELANALKRRGREMAARMGRSWGPPIYGDQRIVVWDLDKVRSSPVRRKATAGGRGR